MKEEIIEGLKAGRTLCVYNTKHNREALEIISDLQKQNLVDVAFVDSREGQYSLYKVKWRVEE